MPGQSARLFSKIQAASSMMSPRGIAAGTSAMIGFGAAAFLRALFFAFLAGALRFVFVRLVAARFVEAAARFVFRFVVFFFDAFFFFAFFRAMIVSFNQPRVESSARAVNGQFARTFQFRALSIVL
jgi:hypothetical protein